MPRLDTAVFRSAVRPTMPGSALVDACEQVWTWLDLPPEERAGRVEDGMRDEAAARQLLNARPFVSLRLARESAVTGAFCSGGQSAVEPDISTDASTAAQRERQRRSTALAEIAQAVTRAWPTAEVPVAHDPRREELSALLLPLSAAMRGCDVGKASLAAVAALAAAIALFERGGEGWVPPFPTDHAWWLGLACCTLGRAAQEAGDLGAARSALARSAEHYARAGATADAAGMRIRLEALERGVRADFDDAAAAALVALLGPQDQLARAASLADLASETHRAGDRFEFARLGRQLAELLEHAGYADPEPDVVGAVERWIPLAAGTVGGDRLLQRLTEVVQHWVVVLGARTSERLGDGSAPDDEGMARALACMRELGSLVGELLDAAQAVEDEVSARIGWWMGDVAEAAPVASLVADPTGSVTEAQAAQAERRAALDEAMHAVRLACNGGPSEAQLIDARRLRDDAVAFGSRVHVAHAELLIAHVALALERWEDVPASSSAALAALSPTAPASLSSLASSSERELYLSAIAYEARALLARRDFASVASRCGPVLDEIEVQRRRVSTPYQQAAFLATRTELYEHAAAAALKLGRHDDLLDTTERLKARGAFRLVRRHAARHADAEPPELAALDRQYVEMNRALLAATPESPLASTLDERRHMVANARAVAAARSDPEAAPLTVATVQSALAPDEGALSWFWLGEQALILIALTSGRFEARFLEWSAADRRTLDRWLRCVPTLSRSASGTAGRDLEPQPAVGEPTSEVDRLVDALAPSLLPAWAREVVADRARVILCPHRELHLFPFHAVRWPASDSSVRDRLGAMVPTRYVPNLASLTVPWDGSRNGPVVAVGVKDFQNPAWPSLEHAETEAREVAAAHGAYGRFVPGATRAGFAALPLSTCRCLHLATHGSSVLAGSAVDDPLDAGLALADGLLDGWQIGALDLRAELVVAAACHSGQRAVAGRGLVRLPGDDLFGLSASFFHAGAGSVLGALWPVDDESARAILVDMHREYADGVAPDVALQKALAAHLANPSRRHTAYDWAPFFLTSLGNARWGAKQ